MTIHVVLFKFREDLPESRIAEILNGFHRFKEMFPGIRSCRWGLNDSPENLNLDFTHCLIMEIEDRKTHLTYLNHPDHVAFAAGTVIPALKDGLNGVLVFDFAA